MYLFSLDYVQNKKDKLFFIVIASMHRSWKNLESHENYFTKIHFPGLNYGGKLLQMSMHRAVNKGR